MNDPRLRDEIEGWREIDERDDRRRIEQEREDRLQDHTPLHQEDDPQDDQD